MHPILAIALAAAAAATLGWWLRRNLATLNYRSGDERDLPAPGPRWWIMWVTVIVIGGLAVAIIYSDDPAVRAACVPLAIAGPWLAAVDLDVMRIPNRVLAPTAAVTAAAVVLVALWAAGPAAAILAALSGLLVGGVFAAIHLVTKGGVGMGDVKLAAVIGIALGPLGLNAAWLALLAGSLAAFVWAKATSRSGPVPYGPWLLLGAWFGCLIPS